MSWLYFNSSPYSQNKAAMAPAESKIIFKFRFNFMCCSQEKEFEFHFDLPPAGAEKAGEKGDFFDKCMSRPPCFRSSPCSQHKASMADAESKITATVHIIGPGYSCEKKFEKKFEPNFVPPPSSGAEKAAEVKGFFLKVFFAELEGFFEELISHMISTLINRFIIVGKVSPDSIKKRLPWLKALLKKFTDCLSSCYEKALAWLTDVLSSCYKKGLAFLKQLYSCCKKALAWLNSKLKPLTDFLSSCCKKGLAFLKQLIDVLYSLCKKGPAFLNALLKKLTDLWKKGLALVNASMKSLAGITNGFFSCVKKGFAWLGFI